MSPITVIGAGSWGTALAIQLARNGQAVRLWGRNDSMREMEISRCNKQYLPDIKLPDLIELHHDLSVAVKEVSDILVAVPSHCFRNVLLELKNLCPSDIRIAWATKGLDADQGKLLHEVVFEVFGPSLPIAILAGPSFAKEVAMGLPTAVTLTSNNVNFERDLVKRFHGNHFRVYTQTDMVGVQLCGAVKNCLAVATGISDGLGYGANSRSALITRGLSEMTRLGLAMGGQLETFMGLAGVGDLVLTCTDNQSRNRRFGFAVGQGMDISRAEESIGQVVEGKSNAYKVMALAKQYQIEMPITELVVLVLEGVITPWESVERLFAREPKQENINSNP